ncbi:MAG: AzlD domain-containing protein [Oscillospiraceae bacterium]|nr:AzlD domain-containing protein [Oscillospiraceae bacterium]
MQNNVYIYILIMAGVSFVIRTLPLTLIRRPIRSKFIKSFLYYVPYVTLSVMTFPAILTATQSPIAGIAALLLGIVAAYFNAGLLKVAACCCSVVLLLEFFLIR